MYNIGDKVEVCYSASQWVCAHITKIRNGIIYLKSVDGVNYVCSLSAAAKDIRVPLSSDEAFIKECEDRASPRLTRAIRMLKDARAQQALVTKVNNDLSDMFSKADQRCRHLDDSLLMLNDKYCTLEKAYNSMVESAKIHMNKANEAQNKIEYLDHSVLTLSEKFTQAMHSLCAQETINATITKENEQLRAKIARMRAITFEE